jgi:hypothetical protein
MEKKERSATSYLISILLQAIVLVILISITANLLNERQGNNGLVLFPSAVSNPGNLVGDYLSSFKWILISLILLFLISYGFIFYIKINQTISKKFDVLRAAAWELIKAMENAGPGGPESRAFKAETTVERFAVAGNVLVEREAAKPALITSGAGKDFALTQSGVGLMRQYWDDAAKFRRGRGYVRTGLMLLLTLVEQKNLHGARMLMIDYMKQRRENPELPPLVNMRYFLDLPVSDDDVDARSSQSYLGYLTSYFALREAETRVFEGLQYRTPGVDGQPSLVVHDGDVVKAMREFIRSDNTAQAFVESLS